MKILLYGPQGSGKTSVGVGKLKKMFSMIKFEVIEEGGDPPDNGSFIRVTNSIADQSLALDYDFTIDMTALHYLTGVRL